MVPLATTTITVKRPAGGPVDISEPLPAASTVVAGVRAHISTPSGRGTEVGGQESVTTFRLDADPCDLTYQDQIVDDTTGETYSVVWAKQRRGLGLDHVAAGLEQVAGAAA